jgi:hypothetical protein
MKTNRKLIAGFFVVFGLLAMLASDVLAVVGMPATPMSYAGVARRTVRRGGAVVIVR